VVGTVQRTRACGPHAPPHKDRDKDQKEDSGNFKPQNPAHTAKGTQKAADPAQKAAPRPVRNLPRRWCANPAIHSRLDYVCPRTGCCRRAPAHALTRHATGNAQSDPQNPSNVFRFHFDMMVAATVEALLFESSCPLPVALGPLRK